MVNTISITQAAKVLCGDGTYIRNRTCASVIERIGQLRKKFNAELSTKNIFAALNSISRSWHPVHRIDTKRPVKQETPVKQLTLIADEVPVEQPILVDNGVPTLEGKVPVSDTPIPVENVTKIDTKTFVSDHVIIDTNKKTVELVITDPAVSSVVNSLRNDGFSIFVK